MPMIAKAAGAFNRFEVKYIIAATAIPPLVRQLAPYTRPDGNMTDPQGYRVHSVYWDSPGLAVFWEKVEGLEVRRKLRFRRYGDSPDIFAEIKGRVDRTVQKRRFRLSESEAERLLGRTGPVALAGDGSHPVASEVEAFIHQYRLEPRVGITYRRYALVGSETSDLRITFDRRVQYSTSELSMTPLARGKYLLDPRHAVMEVKYNGRVPMWLSKLISREGFVLQRLSKYCAAIDRVYFRGQLT
jgi:hypothetical protein